jgi:hypothetical protein
MGSIHYSTATDGIEVGRWFGKSVRNGNTISHESSIYLGKLDFPGRFVATPSIGPFTIMVFK